VKGSIPKADETNENTRHVADRGANRSAVHEAHREVNPSKTGGGIVRASETEGAEPAGLVARRGARGVAASPRWVKWYERVRRVI
jgi:hypothetical protein